MDMLYIIIYIYIHSVSEGRRENFCELIEHVKLNKKVLYFAKFAIINELLIIDHISARSRIGSPQPDTDLLARDRPPPRLT